MNILRFTGYLFSFVFFMSLMPRYHPGTINVVETANKNDPTYLVRFEDGDVCSVRIDQLVLLPRPKIESKLCLFLVMFLSQIHRESGQLFINFF